MVLKTDRLIGIITLLLQRGKVTAPELAARFEVSRRTISRDIDDICRAGIPLVTTQGQGGGISIAPGYAIDRSVLTRDELQMVLASLSAVDSVSRVSYLRTVLEKLSAQSISVDDTISIDLASFYRTPLTEKIELLRTAIRTRRCVTFTYYAPSGESCRTIEPYRILFRWSSWYVLGWCREREDFRTFKLNRLWNLRETDETFAPRPIPSEKLHPEHYFETENYRLEAIFDPSMRWRLIEEYGVGCYTEREDGLYFTCGFTGYENMASWVLSFGDRVRILAPEELRQDRLAQAKNILNQK